MRVGSCHPLAADESGRAPRLRRRMQLPPPPLPHPPPTRWASHVIKRWRCWRARKDSCSGAVATVRWPEAAAICCFFQTAEVRRARPRRKDATMRCLLVPHRYLLRRVDPPTTRLRSLPPMHPIKTHRACPPEGDIGSVSWAAKGNIPCVLVGMKGGGEGMRRGGVKGT